LVILKVFAPWCRACKGLEPHFNGMVKDKTNKQLPIIWADLSIANNKDYVKSIGVLALPTIQFYVHGGRVDTFPCGPSKVPILKRKLIQLISDNVDTKTKKVNPQGMAVVGEEMMAAEKVETNKHVISEEESERIRAIPYFADLSEDEFVSVMAKSKELSFDSGSIIMREGNEGRTFYILTKGEVEICQKTSFEDPLTTPPKYLGTVINRLTIGDYFGERALITKEPRAASIRASALTLCLAFDKDDFPASSVLSGNVDGSTAATQERVDVANDKYGVSLKDIAIMDKKQFQDTLLANQVRGSVNTPGPIEGVDDTRGVAGFKLEVEGTAIIPLLMRFKLLRSVGRCFNYIMSNRLRFGDEGTRRRRTMLIKLLSPSQHVEFTDAFTLIDSDNSGEVTLMEVRASMELLGDEKTDGDWLAMIQTGRGGRDGKEVISYQDFMGIMAEAEFYHLFLDTFRALDTQDSGFVRAGDLDRVLCGVRDLISDDRKSIIDVSDSDMLIDYEQFSRMLLGSALK
jgi:calmodulin